MLLNFEWLLKREGYLLPTRARKITCQRFNWCFRPAWWWLEHSIETSTSYFLSSSW